MKLEGTHLLELFFYAATAFKGQFGQFGDLFLGKLSVRANQFDQSRNGLSHRFLHHVILGAPPCGQSTDRNPALCGVWPGKLARERRQQHLREREEMRALASHVRDGPNEIGWQGLLACCTDKPHCVLSVFLRRWSSRLAARCPIIGLPETPADPTKTLRAVSCKIERVRTSERFMKNIEKAIAGAEIEGQIRTPPEFVLHIAKVLRFAKPVNAGSAPVRVAVLTWLAAKAVAEAKETVPLAVFPLFK
jgi:hypothetical protein